MRPEGDGFFSVRVDGVGAGARYAFRLDGGPELPDPYSRAQPEGVLGRSQVEDPKAFGWSDAGFRPCSLERLVIYEAHVGTFHPEGSFRALAGCCCELSDLGFTALELMPPMSFPGERNWGYDGVSWFAPAKAYGTPDDLRKLVDSAHASGLAVIVDMVYNHLGPDGNAIGRFFDRLLSSRHRTPWGPAIHLGWRPVRDLVLQSAEALLREFHVDGIRLDSTHALHDEAEPHILQQMVKLADANRRCGQRPWIFCEDHRNLASLALPPDRGGMGTDGIWSEDFHRSLHVSLTAERFDRYRDYEGGAPELARILREGWLYAGQHSSFYGLPRGSDPSGLLPCQIVIGVQNHDQVGNRALGQRLGHLSSPSACRLAAALLLLAPQTPLVFMGQEYAASTPFFFFTDHRPEIGRRVRRGRAREISRSQGLSPSRALATMPDPQDRSTFTRSVLRREERARSPHREILDLYRTLLALRRSHPALQACERGGHDAHAIDDRVLLLHRGRGSGQELLALANLSTGTRILDAPPAPLGSDWRPVLCSESPRFGGREPGEDFFATLRLPAHCVLLFEGCSD